MPPKRQNQNRKEKISGSFIYKKIWFTEEDEFVTLLLCSCGVLRNPVGVEEIKRYMIEEDDTKTTFIKLIGSKEEIVQKREVFVRKGGIQELVSVLSDPNLLSSSKSKETALRAIDNLCFRSPGCLNALMSCKFLDPLMYLLSNGRSPFKNQP
ncbi:hypothetical protein HID58_086760 [Brassica napus]|uniref:Uncharacterized protein n=3 Tax=Brassica TaxID=3705 RepID=A0ABQ7XRA0_BRANA|nr:hypothetical protein HID58_086760 [Brassica napus]